MIRFCAVVAALALFTTTQTARAADGSSGCGPGWYIFKDVSLVSSSLRGTTNGILFPVTTIGMTFGTSNCSAHKIVDNQGESVKFATLAYHDLVVQMAQGKGEHLAAFANTLGCPWQTQIEFNRTLQASFQRIVPTDAVAPEAIVDQVRVELQTQPLLAQACSGAVG
jgi:hypothetical protein